MKSTARKSLVCRDPAAGPVRLQGAINRGVTRKEKQMFDDDDDDETAPEHVKRLRAEREKYEEERSNTSLGAGENWGRDWAGGADYAALKKWAERAEATYDFEHASLPDAGWEDFPEDGDAPSYARGFLSTVMEVFEQVEAG